MVSNYDKVKVDYGNKFRMISGDIYNDYIKNLINSKQLTFSDIGVWLYLCEHMKPFSTEISISIRQFAKDFSRAKSHILNQVHKLIRYGLIIKKDNKLYINLNYATRGNEVYEDIYSLCGSKLNLKEDLCMAKSREEDIDYSVAF